MNQPHQGLSWRRSTRCANNACIEVARMDGSYLLRDSKDPAGTTLTFSTAEWDAFVAGVRDGEFHFG